jgi:hypothetical protein
MSEGLRDVPILLAAGREEQTLGEGTKDAVERVTNRFLLGQDPGCGSGADACAELAPKRPKR